MNSEVIVLVLVGVIACLGLLAWYYQQRHSWWYKDNYNPELPNVSLYGGTQREQSLLTTEYPSGVEVNTQHLSESFPYIARQHLLSTAEQTLLKALLTTLHSQPYWVFSKVRLGDVLDIATHLSERDKRAAKERIKQRCLDFVLCHAETLTIVGVIALDDEIDQRKLDTLIYDKFIDLALAAAAIPLLHLPMQPSYQLPELREALQKTFNIVFSLPTQPSIKPVSIAEEDKPICPKCHLPLFKTKIKNGQQAGKKVWACSNYPMCKTVLPCP